MSNNSAAIRRIKAYFGPQLDDDSIAAILAVCDDDVDRAIAFLQGDGAAPAYDLHTLSQNSDTLPPDYPRPARGAPPAPPGAPSAPPGPVAAARRLFTDPAATLREHHDFQCAHYAEYVCVLLLLLHDGVEVQRACRPRVLAAAWARHDYALVDTLTTAHAELFQLPQVLAALEMLDARRQAAAVQRRLDRLAAAGCTDGPRVGALRGRLTELAREEHIGSLTKAVVRHARRWVRRLTAEQLVFYALTLPREPWQALANLLHLAPSDFASISPEKRDDDDENASQEAAHPAAAATGAEAASSEEKEDEEKKKDERKETKEKSREERKREAVRDTFLGYVFDETTAGPESLLAQCQHLSARNVVELATRFRIPYSFVRTRVKPLPEAAKPVLARQMPLDTLIWYHEELACPAVNAVLRARLEAGERPTLGYGKLMERLMYFDAQALPFAALLLPVAEERLRAIQLALDEPVYCFGDASYSMDVAIRCSTIIGSVLASLTNAPLRFFNDRVVALPHTPRTTREVMDAVRTVRADGLTAPACALWPLYRARVAAKFVVMVTDEVENGRADGEYWPTLYARYVRDVAPACTAVFVSFLGGGTEKGRMVAALEALGVTRVIQFRLEGARPDLTKLDTILGLLAAESSAFPAQVDVLREALAAGGLAGVMQRLQAPLIPRQAHEHGEQVHEEQPGEMGAPEEERAVKEESDAESGKCVVCMDRAARIAMLPCGHLCCCEDCARGLAQCPVCRTPVQTTQRIFSAGV